jgi:dGTPase
VNHDIDDAIRAGLLRGEDLPPEPARILGGSSSSRISALVRDVVTQTLDGGLTEIRISPPVLGAMLELRGFLFAAVHENTIARAEFRKATDVLSAAARGFLAGMTDRYAVRLFEQLFIPKPWATE